MVETQMEQSRQGARVTPHVRRAKVELTAHGSEAEVGTGKTAAEPERPRTTVQTEGRQSQRDGGQRRSRKPGVLWRNKGDT